MTVSVPRGTLEGWYGTWSCRRRWLASWQTWYREHCECKALDVKFTISLLHTFINYIYYLNSTNVCESLYLSTCSWSDAEALVQLYLLSHPQSSLATSGECTQEKGLVEV